MIESKNLVPLAYSNSRDYRAILKLLDLIICSAKSDCDNLPKIFNPMLCPERLLPHLASYVGYKYDYNLLQYTNRLIIKHYHTLIRNRGSFTGIKQAIALSMNATGKYDITNVSMFDLYYDRENNIIKVFLYSTNYINKIWDLLEVVRPAGTKLEVIIADHIGVSDQAEIYDNVTCIAVYNYNPENINVQTMNNFTVSIGNYRLLIDYFAPEPTILNNFPNPSGSGSINGVIVVNDAVESNRGNYKFRTKVESVTNPETGTTKEVEYIRGYKIDTLRADDSAMNKEINTPYCLDDAGNIIHADVYQGYDQHGNLNYNTDNDNLYDTVMSKEYIDRFVITDRFKISNRSRIGFGEVAKHEVQYPHIYVRLPKDDPKSDRLSLEFWYKNGHRKFIEGSQYQNNVINTLKGRNNYKYVIFDNSDTGGRNAYKYIKDDDYVLLLEYIDGNGSTKSQYIVASTDIYIDMSGENRIDDIIVSNISFTGEFSLNDLDYYEWYPRDNT